MKINKIYDIVIIGGGFYGCCLALYMKSNNYSVLLVEKEDDILKRASAINQARVHTGFHYPRSMTTAIRSLLNFPRFVYEFRKAITDDFTMCYAIAKQGSKVTANRFYKMFQEINAPIEKAPQNIRNLFDLNMVEDVFSVKEFAFDHDILRNILKERLELAKVDICLNTDITSSSPYEVDKLELITSTGES